MGLIDDKLPVDIVKKIAIMDIQPVCLVRHWLFTQVRSLFWSLKPYKPMIIERPLSIVEQVNQIIRQRIRDGIYPPGGRMPSEGDLAAEMGISRSTLRTAMASLVSEGLVLRRQGEGTFVNRHGFEMRTQIQNFWSFTRLIEESGFSPEVRSVMVTFRAGSEKEICDLEIQDPGQARMFVFQRLFLAESRPVIFSTNVIPAAFLVKDPGEYRPQSSLNDFLHAYTDQEIAYSTSDVTAVLPPNEVALALQIDPCIPILQLHDVFFNRAGQPVAAGINYYNEKILGMRLVRTRDG